MYAIVECGGKQYRVQEGDQVRVEKLPLAVGDSVTLDKVLLIGGEQTIIGNPMIEGAQVSARVLLQDKEKKIMIFRYKAKKNVRVRRGHRQPFTSLLIEQILQNCPAVVKPEAPAAKKTAKVEQAATVESIEPAAPVKKKAAVKPKEVVADGTEPKPRTRAKKTDKAESEA